MECVDVRAVRRKSGLTQQAFAKTFGFTVGALRDWEQGRKRPDRSARVLLAVIEAAPDTVAIAVTALERHQ
jgi:putative transcriptional regulator